MYIDNTLVDSSTETYGTVYSNNKRNLGRRKYSSMASADQFYVGDMDEVRVFTRALSTGEIQKLYTSNLSAKADHWEYQVNYTHTPDRNIGTYIYGFSGSDAITDSNNNTTISTGYFTKNLSCGTGLSISRNNDNLVHS